VTVSIGLSAKTNNLLLANQVQFQQFRVIERFYVEASNNAMVVGHFSNDLQFFVD